MLSIEQIDDTIDSLVRLKESMLNKNSEEKWQPDGGDYSVECDGNVSYNGVCRSEGNIRNFGCEFETEEEAIKASNFYRRYHRLYKLAQELNPPDWQPDFNDGYNLAITKFHNGAYGVELIPSRDYLGAVYFDSFEIAQKAIKILMQEDEQ